MIGSPSFAVTRPIRAVSFFVIVVASVKMSTVSNPRREMCSNPAPVSTPACSNALLMMPNFMWCAKF